MNVIHQKGRAYVVGLKFNRKVGFKGEELKASVVAACIPPDLGDCQLRSGEGRNRHLYPVRTAYSLLVAKLKQGGAREWGHQLIRTIGEACRGILRETLGKTIDWVIRRTMKESLSKEAILGKPALA